MSAEVDESRLWTPIVHIITTCYFRAHVAADIRSGAPDHGAMNAQTKWFTVALGYNQAIEIRAETRESCATRAVYRAQARRSKVKAQRPR
jgi:hypothetical protein